MKLDGLSLGELAEVEAGIKAARQGAVAREVARIETAAKTAGFTLEDLIGKATARRAREGRP